MADRFAALATFRAVVEAGSSTAAARRLRVSKALASKRIGEFKARLGLRLLQRSTRRLELTSAGARLHTKAREALIWAEEAFEDAGGAREGLPGWCGSPRR